MAQGLWLSLWLDFQGWLVVILIAPVVLMVGGGIFKSPVWWLIGYVAPPFLLILFALLASK